MEYATRIQEKEPLKFITMNGVCVWHDAFDLRWNAAVEVYLATRNMLIQEAFTPDSHYSMDAMIQLMRDNLIKHGRRFDYASMELICDAIEDYLKGPDYYRHPVGEKLFQQARVKAEKLEPLQQIPGAPDAIDIVELEQNANDENVVVPPRDTDTAAARRGDIVHRILRKAKRTIRSEKVSPVPRQENFDRNELAIIPNDGWCRPWRILQHAGKALAVDTTGQRGAMRVRDEQRNEELRNRFEHLAQILSEDTAVLGAYRESREEMTSFEFWRRYLEEAKR